MELLFPVFLIEKNVSESSLKNADPLGLYVISHFSVVILLHSRWSRKRLLRD